MIPIINGVLLAVSSSLAASIVTKATVTMVLGLVGTWLARRSRAAVRHALLAATFGVLLLLPIASFIAPPIRITTQVADQERIAPAFLGPVEAIPPAAQAHPKVGVTSVGPRPAGLSLSALLLTGWITGTALFLLPVMMGLWQVRRLRRSALPWRQGQSVAEELALDAGIHRRVEVLLHEALPGPMTCGVMHPAIVLSEDAQTWEEEDLNRAMVHELEHVRRCDRLTHSLARAVCAVYWFHPLVWIAWRQLAVEAERSCDDAVLGRAEATDYADQLVGLARRLSMSAGSPAAKWSLLSMANRADLAVRVGAVLDIRQRRGQVGKFSVTLACVGATIVVVTMSPLRIARADQSTDWQTAAGGRRAFEVASVKPSTRFQLPSFPLDNRNAKNPGGRFLATFPLWTYISFAYKLEPFQKATSQAPKWVDTDRFEIEARAEGNPTKDQMRLMMQSLLADRFKLAVHYETRQIPVFDLILAKSGKTGPKLRPHSEGPPCPDSYTMPTQSISPLASGVFPANCGSAAMWERKGVRLIGDRNTTMSLLADAIYSYGAMAGEVDRPVVDKTGLNGTFDFTIEHTRGENDKFVPPGPPKADAPPSDPQGTSFLDAVREQLGLKLVSSKGPVRILVIDHVDRPSEN